MSFNRSNKGSVSYYSSNDTVQRSNVIRNTSSW